MKKALNPNSFTRVSQKLRRSPSLGGDQKLIIAYVLGWQRAGKECTASNATVSTEHGISTTTLWRIITKLNKKPFFQSKAWPSKTSNGGYFNRKKMVVFEDLLEAYLDEESANFEPRSAQKPERQGPSLPHEATGDQLDFEPAEDTFGEKENQACEVDEQEPTPATAAMSVTRVGQLLTEPNNGMPREKAIKLLVAVFDSCITDTETPLTEMETAIRTTIINQHRLTPSEGIKLLDWVGFFMQDEVIPYIESLKQSELVG